MRKDKVRNEYIRGTVKVERLRNEDEGGQAEVVWTCHEERPEICRKKGHGNGVTRKKKKKKEEKERRKEEKKRGRSKRRFLDAVKEDMGEFGTRWKDIGKRMLWRSIIRCGYP